MTQNRWTAVDGYITDLLVPSDPVLEATLEASDAAGLPSHHVSPNQGKMLYLLASLIRARRILEIGTLAGYSSLWLARALPPAGKLITLEANPLHADVARSNFRRAGVSGRIDLRVGPAAAGLARMIQEGQEPFDLVFIDADKENHATYLESALKLSRPGTLIIGDNVVRGGDVVDPNSPDPRVQGVRRFYERLSAAPNVSATAIQTVGSKGYDGFALALVRSPDS
jgi:predicted O-methyltransferase YrrM